MMGVRMMKRKRVMRQNDFGQNNEGGAGEVRMMVVRMMKRKRRQNDEEGRGMRQKNGAEKGC